MNLPWSSSSIDARSYTALWCGGSGRGGGPETGTPTTAVIEVLDVAGVGGVAMAFIVMNLSGEENRNLTRQFWTRNVVGAKQGKI